MQVKDSGSVNEWLSHLYQNIWPGWMDLEDLIYRPVLQKAVITLVTGVCKMVEQMYI